MSYAKVHVIERPILFTGGLAEKTLGTTAPESMISVSVSDMTAWIVEVTAKPASGHDGVDGTVGMKLADDNGTSYTSIPIAITATTWTLTANTKQVVGAIPFNSSNYVNFAGVMACAQWLNVTLINGDNSEDVVVSRVRLLGWPL